MQMQTGGGIGGPPGLAATINMESFSQALQVSLIDGASVALPVRRQADEYLMQLTVTVEGLGLAFHIIDNEEFNAVRVFWAFSTVLFHLPAIGHHMQPQQCYTSLMSWLQRTLAMAASGTGGPYVDMVLSKHAQVMVVGVQELWLQGQWPFFSDLFGLIQHTLSGGQSTSSSYPPETVLSYSMRFYDCIDERVVNQSVQRTKEQRERDTAIKDRMRMEVIPDLVKVFYGILCTFHHSNAELVSLCLGVTQNYIDWADVTYFLNPEWINLFYFLMSIPSLRSKVCECLTMLVGKGQPTPELKLQTLTTMRLVESIPAMVDAVIAAELQKPMATSALYCLSALDMGGAETGPLEEDPYLANVCSLVVCTATEAGKTAAQLTAAAPILHAVVPHAVRLFDLPLYVTKEQILPWLQAYVKTPFVAPEEEEQIVSSLLRQSLLPDNENYAFVDVVVDQRKQVLNITRVLGKKNPRLVTTHCVTVLQSICEQGAELVKLPFPQVEAAIRYVYELGEGIPLATALREPNNEFTVMISMLLRSGVVHHPSSVVNLAYFETLERYGAFFVCYKEAIPTLLQHFLQSEAGVCNRNPKVRGKNCEVFRRLVSTLKAQFAEHSPTIIAALLVVLGHTAEAPGVELPRQLATQLTPSDRCDLYEGLGALLASTDMTCCATVVQAIVSHLQTCTQQFASGAQQHLHADMALAVADDISYLSSLAKGLGGIESSRMPDSPPLPPRDVPQVAAAVFPPSLFELPQAADSGAADAGNSIPQSVRVFFVVTDAVMQTLHTWGGHLTVREKSVAFMQQVVKILASECLGFVRSFIVSMIPNTTLQEVGRLCRLLFQGVRQTRSASVSTVVELLPLLLNKVNELAGNVEDIETVLGVVAESIKERSETFRSFFYLLHAITNSGAIQCFEHPSCQACLPLILTMVTSALRTSVESELVTKSFQIVGRLVAVWCTVGSDLENWVTTQYLPMAFQVAVGWKIDGKALALIGEFGSTVVSMTIKLGDRGLYAIYALLTAPPFAVPVNDAHGFLSHVKDVAVEFSGSNPGKQSPGSKVRNQLKDLLTAVQQRNGLTPQ